MAKKQQLSDKGKGAPQRMPYLQSKRQFHLLIKVKYTIITKNVRDFVDLSCNPRKIKKQIIPMNTEIYMVHPKSDYVHGAAPCHLPPTYCEVRSAGLDIGVQYLRLKKLNRE